MTMALESQGVTKQQTADILATAMEAEFKKIQAGKTVKLEQTERLTRLVMEFQGLSPAIKSVLQAPCAKLDQIRKDFGKNDGGYKLWETTKNDIATLTAEKSSLEGKKAALVKQQTALEAAPAGKDRDAKLAKVTQDITAKETAITAKDTAIADKQKVLATSEQALAALDTKVKAQRAILRDRLGEFLADPANAEVIKKSNIVETLRRRAIMGVKFRFGGHIIRLESVGSSGIVVDDPYGKLTNPGTDRKTAQYRGDDYNKVEDSKKETSKDQGMDRDWTWDFVGTVFLEGCTVRFVE